jgi:hypothetical protein
MLPLSVSAMTLDPNSRFEAVGQAFQLAAASRRGDLTPLSPHEKKKKIQ